MHLHSIIIERQSARVSGVVIRLVVPTPTVTHADIVEIIIIADNISRDLGYTHRFQ